jgi:HlyD family secretion protein
MTATADIVTWTSSNVLLVPNAALRFRPSTPGAEAWRIEGGIASDRWYLVRPRRAAAGPERTATISAAARSRRSM